MNRAVIFDMGGTLLRFARAGDGSWRAFESQGLRGLYRYLVDEGHPLQAHEDAFVEALFTRMVTGWEQATGGHINLRTAEWIAAGAADHALTLDEAALLEATRRYVMPLRAGISAAPGAADTLAALRERGYRVGLISNTAWPAELHLEDLEELGLLHHIEHPIFSGDLGVWKPNRAIFQHALDALEVAPEQAVFVGDNPREDVRGAQAIGMRAVWIRNTTFPLSGERPDLIIDELPELLPWLEQ